MKGSHHVAECRLENQCRQILLLCHGNRIPTAYPILRWYQTAAKKDTCNHCMSTATECWIPVLQRHLGKTQWNTGNTTKLVGECWHTKSQRLTKHRKAMVLELCPSASIQHYKDNYHSLCYLGLPWLLSGLQDLHRQLPVSTRSHHYLKQQAAVVFQPQTEYITNTVWPNKNYCP